MASQPPPSVEHQCSPGAFLARHSASILPIPHFEIHLRSLSVPRPLGLLINCFHFLALLRLAIFLKAHRMGNDSAVHAQSTSKPSSGLPSDSLRLCSNSRTIGSRLGLRSSGVNRYLRLFSAALRVLPTCSEFQVGGNITSSIPCAVSRLAVVSPNRRLWPVRLRCRDRVSLFQRCLR